MKNLKFSFLLLSFLILATSAFSQTKIGIRTGINNSNWTLKAEGSNQEDLDLFEIRSSVLLAIPIEINLSEKIALQPELLYSQYGTKFETSYFEQTALSKYIFS